MSQSGGVLERVSVWWSIRESGGLVGYLESVVVQSGAVSERVMVYWGIGESESGHIEY